MFFSTYVLTKKGPLAKIWLAAHWDKKLTRNDVKVIDLKQTVVQIVHPVVPIALRTSGELLVGVVRIYSLKVRHLLKEAVDAAHSLRVVNVQVVKEQGAKDSAYAVTMDIVVGRTAADQLCEADFGSIADLLAKKPVDGGAHVAGEDQASVIGSAWFPVDASQLFEETTMSQTDGDIAKLRADLLAFGEMETRRAESSSAASGGKKSSTVSSIEKARASGLQAAANGDDLDIGMPLPDVNAADLFMLDDAGMLMLMDPQMGGGDLPDMLQLDPLASEAAAAPEAAAALRIHKKKLANIIDAAETISKEELKKMYDDQSDIVNHEARHGPVDEQEGRDRDVLRHAEGNITRMEPVSFLPNSALRAVFEAAVRSSVEQVQREEMERFRASDATTGRKTGAGGAPFLSDDLQEDGGALLPPPTDANFDYVAEELPAQPEGGNGRKRGRDTDGPSGTKLSSSTLRTGERILATFTKAKPLVSFEAYAKGMRRLEAARSFVDLLQLASHDMVRLSQAAPYAELSIGKLAKLESIAATA